MCACLHADVGVKSSGAMLLCGEDTLSFLSCLRQRALLRTAAIARSPEHAVSSPLFHQVQCNNQPHNLTHQVSKTVFRLQKQGIQVTPKILHRVKKKEAWKAVRRERKEQAKGDRVPDPVWYDWSEELGMHEMRKLSITQSEEEGVDEFLIFLEEARPTRQIAIPGIDNTGLHASKGAGSISMQRKPANVQKQRKFRRKRSIGDCSASPIQSVSQVWRSNSSLRVEDALPLHENASEFCLPWACKPLSEDLGAANELQEYALNRTEVSNMRGRTYVLNLDEGFGKSRQKSMAYTRHLADKELIETSNLEKRNLHVYTEGSDHASSAYTPENHRCNVVDDTSSMYAPTHGLKVELPPPASTGTLSSSMETAITDKNIHGNYLPARKKPHLLKDLDMVQTEEFLDEKVEEEPNPIKVPNTAQIEKFLDDEIGELPKGQETWMKGVGLIETRKPEFSKEVKDRIIARRKGDWSVLNEEADSESELIAHSMGPFDGRAALLEDRRIQRLATRLHDVNYWISKVHFSKIMHSGKMKLTEDRVTRVIQILGEKGNWRRAMQVVQWVHKRQRYHFHTSKFIFTTLISILGKARRPVEALTVFSVMRENFSSYPDMAAYHAVAVTLGQAGQLKKLILLVESLERGPPQPIKFIPVVKWNPVLLPDIVVYNSVLIACISAKEWAGVTWTWEEIEKRRIKPNGATFGLTIEAMVKANNFDQAIRYYNRMERAGFPPNAVTYKCLVEAFGKAKMIDEAIELVKEMEASGTVATSSVYFALACSFCIAGQLKEALAQVKKMQDFSSRKPDVVTYTGLIRTCYKVGRIQDAIFLFKHMQHTCAPNVRTCNEMIELYGWNCMFEEARKVYEGVKMGQLESCLLYDSATRLSCDSFTFESMLKAALVSEKWNYFDSVYWDMTSQGYFLRGKTNRWILLKAARLNKIDIVDDMLRRLRKSGEVPQLRLYECHILSCLQAKCFQKTILYLNDMRIDGYELTPTIYFLQEYVQKETWDSFTKTLTSLESHQLLPSWQITF